MSAVLALISTHADAQAPPPTVVVEPHTVNSSAKLHALLATNQTAVDAYLTPGTHLLGTTYVVHDGKRLTLRSDGAVLDAQGQTRHVLVQDEAEHVSNRPWTTPSSTTVEVDYNKPFDFNSSGGDPRVQEVSLGSM